MINMTDLLRLRKLDEFLIGAAIEESATYFILSFNYFIIESNIQLWCPVDIERKEVTCTSLLLPFSIN